MDLDGGVLVSPTAEVPVIEGEVVTAIRTLAGRGVGKKTITREVGVAVNTVRRYLRRPIEAGVQMRPTARRLTDERRREARELFEGPAAGNAVVVHRLLATRGFAKCPDARASGRGHSTSPARLDAGDGTGRDDARRPAPDRSAVVPAAERLQGSSMTADSRKYLVDQSPDLRGFR